ncbi:MAG TPA: hypothetical protein VGR35_04910 [Tepidisphaeraceae bacterium]|nr:hypothetical protein [Tepidisphaeraceae bacterium]
MRFSAGLVALLFVAGGVSCAEKHPPNERTASVADAAPPRPNNGGAAQPQVGQSAAIPKGAQWTILCREIGGAGHVQRARQLRDNLVNTTGMRDWHLLHKEDSSVLYYGYYKTYNEPKAKADRTKIDSMSDANGRRPFRMAHMTPLDAADPGGPPEWNLANAKGYWSLQIGAYMGSPERKQFAVDAVRAARQQGIEAYYHHGENMSLVCVGSWPREAVRLADDELRAGDQGQIKVVLPPLTPDVKEAPEIRGKGGRKLHVEALRNEVLDPTLKAAMEQYPTNAINGQTMVVRRTDPRTGQVREMADASFPVPIPSGESTLLDGGGIPLPPPPEETFDIAPRSGVGSTGARRTTNGS